MHKIDFITTKDGNLTCSINGLALHSKYNPLAEAKRFTDNLSCDFSPEFLIITEPGLGYSIKNLQERFPTAEIYSIHYNKELFEKNKLTKKLLIENIKDSASLPNKLIELIGEEGICSALFISWPASRNIFPEIDEAVWQQIKEAVKTSHTLLATRTYFTEKWFLNSIRLFRSRNNFFNLKKINNPVVICASGPSLKNSIPLLKQKRNQYFLLAVSSACLPLLNAGLIPDAVISTDGGYWAKKHLECLKKNPEIPLILASEGSCPFQVLKASPIIPLTYPDGAASLLANMIGINSSVGMRNGTVSGTALDFAKKLTSREIFFCGLDLASGKDMQHTGPNNLEIRALSADNKILCREKRQNNSRFNTGSLSIYENWFKSLSAEYCSRVYRLSDNFKFSNKLGFIIDVSFDFFFEKLDSTENQVCLQKQTVDNSPEKILYFIEEQHETENWLREFFTVDYLTYKKEISGSKKTELLSKIEEKNCRLLKKIKRAIK